MAIPANWDDLIRCDRCIYYRERSCAKKSAQIVDDSVVGFWPSVQPEEWCGEFLDRATHETFDEKAFKIWLRHRNDDEIVGS